MSWKEEGRKIIASKIQKLISNKDDYFSKETKKKTLKKPNVYYKQQNLTAKSL